MRIHDCGGSRKAWAAWQACADAAEEAGGRALVEELRSEVRTDGPKGVNFAGFSEWRGTAPRDRLAVVVEGVGWAMDDNRRVVLHAGQAAFWGPGEWSALGADRDMKRKRKPFCRMLLVSADQLSLDRFLAAADDALSPFAAPAEPEDASGAAMQVFDCGSAADARACYEGYLAAEQPLGTGMARGGGGGWFGGHLWDRDHLAVLVEGSGWAADHQTRRLLGAGQGVFWSAGSWFACGIDAFAEIRMVDAGSVDAFLRHGRAPQ